VYDYGVYYFLTNFMDVAINYLAIIGCVVFSMVVGFLWYGPLFGKKWSKEMDFTKADQEAAMANPKRMYLNYASTALGSAVIAYVLAHALVFGNAYMHTSGLAGQSYGRVLVLARLHGAGIDERSSVWQKNLDHFHHQHSLLLGASARHGGDPCALDVA
jgi:hypothetical protein